MKTFNVQTVKTITTTQIEFDHQDLLDMIRRTCNAQGVQMETSGPGMKISFHMRIPGGGDWSGTDLVVGGDGPLVMTITAETTKSNTEPSNGK